MTKIIDLKGFFGYHVFVQNKNIGRDKNGHKNNIGIYSDVSAWLWLVFDVYYTYAVRWVILSSLLSFFKI